MLRFTRIISLFVACALLIPGAALASQRDRNHDGLPDRWEKQHHLSLQVKQGGRDQDKDGLNNRGEFAAKTDPRDADSDDDGVGDGNEDADNDGVANDAETGNGASERSGSDAPRPGDRHEGETPPYNHVVAFSLAGDLELGRADGTSVTAAVGEHTSLLCAAALPGPFHPCAKTVLVTGAKVVNAKDEVNGSGVHLWSRVLLIGTGDAAAPAAPAPPAPESHPAPAITASVVSFTGGVLTIHRNANGEEPHTTLAGNVEIRCVTVSGGQVTSAVTCGAEALVPGAQLALALGASVDGTFKWTKLYVVTSAPASA